MTRVLLSTGSLYILDVAYVFELAAEIGFDGIEVMCDERFSTRDPAYLMEQRIGYNLPIDVLHTPFSVRVPGWKDTPIDRIQQTLRLAEAVNAESVVVHLPARFSRGVLQAGRLRLVFPWWQGEPQVKRWMERELKQAQARAKVKIAIENMPAMRKFGVRLNYAWWNTVGEWAAVHDHLTLDTTHWGTFGVDPLYAYDIARARVAHVHLSNYDGEEHRLPQRGHLNLAAFLRRLAQTHYSGTLSLELGPEVLECWHDGRLRMHLSEALVFCREQLKA